MNDGSRTARPTMAPMLSSATWTWAGAGPRISGSTTSTARITAAKTRNTELQGITFSSASATGGPTTWPAEPAAVAMPRVSERRSGEAARPTIARITPKPVPAMPKPISTLRSWWPPGVTAKAESASPTA